MWFFWLGGRAVCELGQQAKATGETWSWCGQRWTGRDWVDACGTRNRARQRSRAGERVLKSNNYHLLLDRLRDTSPLSSRQLAPGRMQWDSDFKGFSPFPGPSACHT